MADATANLAYPLQFDPSQFVNKYSSFAGQSLNPYMGGYYGGPTGPTDAHGNPIGSYQTAQAQHDAWNAANPAPAAPSMPPSTTLNSNPVAGVGGHATMSDGMPYGQTNLGRGVVGQADGANNTGGYGAGISGAYGGASTPAMMGVGPQPSQAAPTAPQTNPVDMGQAYLNALANPGKVTTPGATVPQAPSPSNQSGVLQQFLQNWQNNGSQTQGAGNYNNSGFYNALKGMV